MHVERKGARRKAARDLGALMLSVEMVTRQVDVLGATELVHIESDIWEEFVGMAATARQSVDDLCSSIRFSFGSSTELESAIRVYVLNHHRFDARPEVALA